MINAKFGLYSLMLSLMLGSAPAWADVVDISSMNKVEVGSWAELKAAVEDSNNAGKVIVLTKDIQADKNNPITGIGGSGIIIDGGGFTITGQEGTSNGQFINFDNKNSDLVFHNVNFDGIGIYRKTSGTSVTNVVRGSIIYNNSEMKDIHGIFSNNYASSDLDVYGGVIFNAEGKNSIGIINNISGEFLDNYVKSEKMSAYGGAIANKGSSSMDGSIIKNINATFSGNYALSDSSYAEGGAIYNYGTIGDISGDFSGNFAKSDSSDAEGGAIYNANSYYVIPKINNINADFTGNFAKSETSDASGGAIYNGSTIGNITGNFSGNYAQADSGSANGGAIYNTRTPLTLVNSNHQSRWRRVYLSWQQG